MAKQQNKKKLTNKEIEQHLNNVYQGLNQESKVVNTIMKVVTDFIEFTDNTEKFQEFLKNKYKKEEKKDEPDN